MDLIEIRRAVVEVARVLSAAGWRVLVDDGARWTVEQPDVAVALVACDVRSEVAGCDARSTATLVVDCMWPSSACDMVWGASTDLVAAAAAALVDIGWVVRRVQVQSDVDVVMTFERRM